MATNQLVRSGPSTVVDPSTGQQFSDIGIPASMIVTQAAWDKANPKATPSPVDKIPGFGGMQAKLTPDQLQDVANQLRSGNQIISVNGKQYNVMNAQVRADLMKAYPAKAAFTQTPAALPAVDPNAPLPEQNALAQLAKIDPTSEALRTQLGQSYLTPLQQAGGAPSAATLQSYLDLYKQIDPTAAAGQKQLGDVLSQNLALGSQLDPQTQREVEQATRQAQSSRGNVYGTPQMVQEAMTRGQAGLALQQQRQAAMQSYLQSGVSPGATALNLYQQQLANQRAAQQGAVSYLGSGQTPYGAASGYLNQANINAANAATAPSYQYNPQALGLGASFTNPQAGSQMSQLSNQWYQSMLSGYGMTPQNLGGGFNAGKAGAGALTGALSGAVGGAAIGGVGAIPGAIIGGLGGGLSGGFSG